MYSQGVIDYLETKLKMDRPTTEWWRGFLLRVDWSEEDGRKLICYFWPANG